MRVIKVFILSSILLGTLYGCSPLKKTASSETTAFASYANKNYQQAYAQLLAVINNYKSTDQKVPYEVYLKTAYSASQLGNASSAVQYYAEALEDSLTVDAVKDYLLNMNKLGNTAQTNIALNKYSEFLSNNGHGEYVVNQQFSQALRLKDDKAIAELYPQLKSANEEQSMAYLNALEKTDKNKEALLFANKLLSDNPSDLKAKEWKAVHYYNKAEDQYQSLMDAYNKDKNYTTYVYLKRDLKKVTEDFKQSRELFEDLRNQNPAEKKYIKYLKNIYLRLEMKREAAAMDTLLQ